MQDDNKYFAVLYTTRTWCLQTFVREGDTVGLYRVMERGHVKLFSSQAEAMEYAKRL